MNYSTKNLLSSLFILLVLFTACDDPKDIGIELQPQNALGVVFTDTATVKTSTILVDSVNTTNTALLVVGEYLDPIFGKITASSFFTLTVGRSAVNLGINPQFSRAELSLDYAYSYGDTTKPQTISVHRLTNDFNLRTSYYNFSNLAYDPTPIGSLTFSAKDIVGDKLKIPLDDGFRDEFASLVSSTDSLTQSQVNSLAKGLVLVSEDGNAILGFNVSQGLLSTVDLVYQNEDASGNLNDETVYSIAVRNADPANIQNNQLESVRFNRITADRTGTAIEALDESYETLDASETANLAYMQAALGIKVKVEFPYLSEFSKLGVIAVNRADLVIPPIDNFEEPFLPNPENLEFWRLNSNGRVRRVVAAREQRDVNGAVIAILNDTVIVRLPVELANPNAVPLRTEDINRPFFDNISRSYNANITTFIQFIINAENPNYTGVNITDNNGLLISPTLSSTLLNRMVIGGPQNPTKRLQLRIFYTLIESN